MKLWKVIKRNLGSDPVTMYYSNAMDAEEAFCSLVYGEIKRPINYPEVARIPYEGCTWNEIEYWNIESEGF